MAAGHSIDAARWRAMFEQAMARIAGRFRRVEPRATARAFVLGLLSGVERKNCWRLAEQAGHARPGPMQRLLRTARWDADALRDDVRAYVHEHLSADNGVLIVDETGFLKRSFSPDVSSRNERLVLWCRVAPGDGGFVGKAAGHQIGHGQLDHGFGAGWEGFVVAGQAAVEHQPAVGPLDGPAFGQRRESLGAGGPLDDFRVDAEAGGVLDEVLAVTAVDPHLADRGVGCGTWSIR
ncbi:hypothetical protein DF19_32950 [Streptomyces olindensis]|nr:hypothetical protein DF19_32950 [Streptomyces olindensis]